MSGDIDQRDVRLEVEPRPIVGRAWVGDERTTSSLERIRSGTTRAINCRTPVVTSGRT
jgi:hypothetical protein